MRFLVNSGWPVRAFCSCMEESTGQRWDVVTGQMVVQRGEPHIHFWIIFHGCCAGGSPSGLDGVCHQQLLNYLYSWGACDHRHQYSGHALGVGEDMTWLRADIRNRRADGWRNTVAYYGGFHHGTTMLEMFASVRMLRDAGHRGMASWLRVGGPDFVAQDPVTSVVHNLFSLFISA